MLKYIILIMLLGLYMFSVPYYLNFWNSKDATITTGLVTTVINSQQEGRLVTVNMPHSVSVSVTHNYKYFGEVPVYLTAGNVMINVRIFHEIFFNTLYGFIFLFGIFLFSEFSVYSNIKTRINEEWQSFLKA